jgi:single-stranded DNA-binding protein
MKGIHCALQGRLGQNAELRRSVNGKDWCRLSVGVGEGDDLTWVSVAAFEDKARALTGVSKGVEVYVEERLSLSAWTGKDGLSAWTGKDGQQRTGLSVTAWQVQPMGQIGRRKPKVQSEELNDELTF